MRLRPADRDDWARLFAWRNDPVTREHVANTAPVPLETHMQWLETVLEGMRLERPEMQLYIGCDGSRGVTPFVGTVRLDINYATREAEISVTVDPGLRGRGYGYLLVCEAVEEARAMNLDAVVARIKEKNPASLRTFADAEFKFAFIADDGYIVLRRTLNHVAPPAATPAPVAAEPRKRKR